MYLGEQPFLNEHKQSPKFQLTHFSVTTQPFIHPRITAGPGNRVIDKTAFIAKPPQVHSQAFKIHVQQILIVTTKYGKCQEKVHPRSVGTECLGFKLQ